MNLTIPVLLIDLYRVVCQLSSSKSITDDKRGLLRITCKGFLVLLLREGFRDGKLVEN
jgi:hypothetical protein